MMGLDIGTPANLSRGVLKGPGGAERSQASSSTPLPDNGASPRSARSDGSAARTKNDAARAADRNAPANSKQAAPASHANSREAGPVDGDRDTDVHEDFATVLAASSPADSTTATPLPTPAADDQANGAAAAPIESSDQLLALLSGSWALPVAGNGATANAGPSATEAASPLVLAPVITPSAGPATTPPPLTAAVAATQLGGAAPNTAPAVPASLQATITPVTQPPLAMAVAAPSPGSEPPATLSTLAASVLAAIGRDAAKPHADGAAPIDGLSADSVPLTATAPVPAPLRAPLPALAPTAPLALPMDPDAGFDDGFSTRIAWMAEQRLGHAQIRLNPEHVGPIEVRVQLDGDRVSAQFSSVHAEVRQAIEASLPRLRDMLGQHGLQLGQADVGQGGTGREGDRGNGHGGDSANGSTDGLQPPLPATLAGSHRLLDEYA